jgi:hypothetical protein
MSLYLYRRYTYSGEFKAGEEDGHGVETHTGYEYCGQYARGTVSGHGVRTLLKTGEKFYGEFKDGKRVPIHPSRTLRLYRS